MRQRGVKPPLCAPKAEQTRIPLKSELTQSHHFPQRVRLIFILLVCVLFALKKWSETVHDTNAKTTQLWLQRHKAIFWFETIGVIFTNGLLSGLGQERWPEGEVPPQILLSRTKLQNCQENQPQVKAVQKPVVFCSLEFFPTSQETVWPHEPCLN